MDAIVYPDWPSPFTESLDRAVEALERADNERDRKEIGERLAEAMIWSGRREHQGWLAVSHLQVVVRDGHEVEAAEWLAQHGIDADPPRFKGRSKRRALGKAFERAGIDPVNGIPDDLFDVSARWSVRRSPARRAST